jgi:undecaprenyl-diphosphatase
MQIKPNIPVPPSLFKLSTMMWLSAFCALAWLFIELALLANSGSPLTWDRSIMLAMRNPLDLGDPIGPRWFEELMRDITALGGTGILSLLTLLTCSYLVMQKNRVLAWFVLITIGTGMLCSFALKYGFSRPRPDLVAHGSYVYTSSFPSGHSMMSAVVYFILCGILLQTQTRRRITIFMLSCTALVVLMIGLSRVYLGVHWPTDVLAGWSAGCLWALFSYRLLRYWQKR